MIPNEAFMSSMTLESVSVGSRTEEDKGQRAGTGLGVLSAGDVARWRCFMLRGRKASSERVSPPTDSDGRRTRYPPQTTASSPGPPQRLRPSSRLRVTSASVTPPTRLLGTDITSQK